eukprot:scaffold17046_cov21-Phaeocystis_antarctica.AAC.1
MGMTIPRGGVGLEAVVSCAAFDEALVGSAARGTPRFRCRMCMWSAAASMPHWTFCDKPRERFSAALTAAAAPSCR